MSLHTPIPLAVERVTIPEASRPSLAAVWTLVLAAMVTTVALTATVLWPMTRQAVNIDHLHSTSADVWMSRWVVYATVSAPVVLLTLAAAVLAALKRVRLSYGWFVVGASLVQGFCIMDLVLYRTFGLHMLTLATFAALPRWEVAGGGLQWAWLVVRWLVALVSFHAAVLFASHRVVKWASANSSRFFQTSLGLTAATCLMVAVTAPHVAPQMWDSQTARERLYGAMVADVRSIVEGPGEKVAQNDPLLRQLDEQASVLYRSSFPLLFGPKPADRTVVQLDRRPNVLVVAVESFREDSLRPDLMPRLYAWSRKGLHATRHYAGSMYSEAGLFALLYGRSPLVFHSTLDARVPPQMCETLRAAGYRTAYFTGHPAVWMRREDYINPQTFDVYERNDQGGWNDWDRRALGSMVKLANEAKDRPVFALTFLMSSHFEYQYPPAYEKHTPVDRNAKWLASQVVEYGAEMRPLILNRYKNTMAFFDDLIADAIEQLDPNNNIVVLTGDHGESIYDDGHYTHGYGFSEAATRVPFTVVGPGIPSRAIDGMSLHVDILPTLLHALAGRAVPLEHQHGRDLLASEPPREHVLLSHCHVNRDRATILLVSSQDRLGMHLDLTTPKLRITGFEDERAFPIAPPALAEPALQKLVQNLAEEFESARR